MDISDAVEETAAGSPYWGRRRQGWAMALLRQIAKEHRDLRAENEQLREEVRRLQAIIVEAHNRYRHEFADSVDAAVEKLFQRLSQRNTDPFGEWPEE